MSIINGKVETQYNKGNPLYYTKGNSLQLTVKFKLCIFHVMIYRASQLLLTTFNFRSLSGHQRNISSIASG